MAFVPKTSKATTDSFPIAFLFDGWDILTSSEQLVSATVTSDLTGITIGTVTVSASNKTVSVTVADGADGTTYRLTCVATTTSGYTLTGYVDLLVTDSVTDGVVIYPSQLLPFFDTRRAMELLYDEGELADDEEVPSGDSIDANARAFAIAQSAWRALLMAATRGKVYSLQELTDLANDPVRGYDLIELVANIFWCRLIKRRRYTKGEPQNEESACQEAEEKLEMLRRAERIFNLEGVVDSTTGTARTNLLGAATAMSVGTVGGRCHATDRFWACTSCHCSPCRCHGSSGSTGRSWWGGC